MLTSRDRNAKRGVSIQHGDTDLELRNRAAGVARHEALTE